MTNLTNNRFYGETLITIMIACLFGTMQPVWGKTKQWKKEPIDFYELTKQIEWSRKNLKQEPIELTQTPELAQD